MKKIEDSIVFEKAYILEKIKENNLSLDDCIGTLRSGAYVFQFGDNFSILSSNTIEFGGKGYLISGTAKFEEMFLNDSLPQIFNGREDIFELHRSKMKDCEAYASSLHLKWPNFFNHNINSSDQLCDSVCREIAIDYMNMDKDVLLEKIFLLVEVIRYRKGYTWSFRQVYGEYTHYYIPSLNNGNKEVWVDLILKSIFRGESWETISKGTEISLTRVNWQE